MSAAAVPEPATGPSAEVTLGRVLRVAGLLVVLAPVALAGVAVVAWTVVVVGAWLVGIVAGGA